MPYAITQAQIRRVTCHGQVRFLRLSSQCGGAKLTKSSGNPLVDDACVSAAQQTRNVQQPPGGRPRSYAVACRKQ